MHAASFPALETDRKPIELGAIPCNRKGLAVTAGVFCLPLSCFAVK